MEMEKNSPLRDVMNSTMEKVREMVDEIGRAHV